MKKESKNRFCFKKARWILAATAALSLYPGSVFAEENIEVCRAVNVDGPANIAKVCKELDCKMVYISTDYVFPGTGEKYYEVDDKTAIVQLINR